MKGPTNWEPDILRQMEFLKEGKTPNQRITEIQQQEVPLTRGQALGRFGLSLLEQAGDIAEKLR